MKVVDLDVNKLIPYDFNNKEHDKEQVNMIANSIKEFGFNQPLVVDVNNIVVVGH
jgi:ParB-like chromosome segregation protein Spo0J